MKKTPLILSITTLAIFISSCASIVSKSKWPLSVNSNPQGAEVTITNRKGVEVFKGTTPSQVKLKSGAKFFKRELYKVKFQMPGYDLKEIPVTCKVNGWYVGNIVFGGFIGLLIVDPATGAMYKLSTSNITETLTQTSSSISEPQLKIYSINDFPDSLKQHLVKIN